MRTIDIHAHITPAGFVEASQKGESWYGMAVDAMAVHRNNPKPPGRRKSAWRT